MNEHYKFCQWCEYYHIGRYKEIEQTNQAFERFQDQSDHIRAYRNYQNQFVIQTVDCLPF